ncbi:MAG TPA: indolepyruvate oxidoreductase subunit beta [Phycisphaerae bacterium]|nr:indolepyruvate oxidoreductase subunit beta [Phycisphaerae bacterium]
MSKVTNIIVAGLGGQGVLKCSDIIADAAFLNGCDVKKAEVHGMSQRGGSVACDVRFGDEVLSPMVPLGQADYLLVLSDGQTENNIHNLKKGGVLITADLIDVEKLENKRSLNVAILGLLSNYLTISEETWLKAIKRQLPEKIHAVNINAFELGRKSSRP